MPPDAIAFTGGQIVAAAGVLITAIGALFGVVLRVLRQEVDAWKGRADRAEKQVDTLLPAMDKLTRALADQGGRVP